MTGHRGIPLASLYWTASLAALTAAVAMAAWYAPTDAASGPVQKITYLHVPAAINTFLACFTVFVANVGYIWQRTRVWDDVADAAAQVAVLFCTVVLVTGMVWARQTWGQWWAWTPLLTFSLVLWLLYVAYLVVRRTLRRAGNREIACAVYGAVAFLDVPLVYLSVKLLPDRHRIDGAFTPEMMHTLVFWLVPTTMLCAGLIKARYGLNRLSNPPPAPVLIELRPPAGMKGAAS